MKRRSLLTAGAATVSVFVAGCSGVIGAGSSNPPDPIVGEIALFNDTPEKKSVSVLIFRNDEIEHWADYTIQGESSSSGNTTENQSEGDTEDTVVIASPLSQEPGEYVIGARLREETEFQTMRLSGKLDTVGMEDCQRIHVVLEPDRIGLARSRMKNCEPADSAR